MPAIRLLPLTLAVAAVMAAFGAAPAVSLAAPCDTPVVNKVACENTKPGADPSTWQIDGAGDATIQGYATQMSVTPGSTINFKIKSATSNFHIDILRLGYYDGDGARISASNLSPTGPSTQPACNTYSDTGLIDCSNWSVTRSWSVPSNAVSGVYIAHLVRNDTGGSSHIMFVVRDETSHSDIVLQTSDATWQAYNEWGGNSLYKCTVACPPGDPAGYKSAYKVSYNRPNTIAVDDGGRSAMFSGGEYPLIRFLEANGYDMSYVSSGDVGRRGNLLLNHHLFISSGHDEYWSKSQRTSMETARDAGVNLAFFSGNTGFWRTRWESSPDSAQDRVLVSYKDTHFQEQQDPVEWTGTWRDPRFTTAADNPPENALLGQSFLVNSGTSHITVPWQFRNLRMWKNTAVGALGTGQSVDLAPQTLGYEWDEDADNGFRPAGNFKISSTTVSGVEAFTDYGSTTKQNATATHNMTMYKAPSGARVFNTGTVQFSWGLDVENWAWNEPDRNMQQMVVNVFADMGSQPATRLSGLFAASASTDTTRPTSTITSPPATVADGASVTLSGTASDAGGVVAGVEVSTDGGAHWHPASGTTSWTYTWKAHGHPSTVIKTRAVDDSGNIQIPGAGSTVNVNCPCSIWGTNVAPPGTDGDSGDPTPVEVGVKFKTSVYGKVSGMRFYKAAANTGTHLGTLWNESGTALATATFTGESASGWQTVTFSSPVQVTPGTTYIASYHAPNGHYSASSDYFYRDPSPGPNGGALLESSPLEVIRNTASVGNGVFAYAPASTFPNLGFRGTNYWVDVIFSPTPAPGQVTGVSATEAGRTSANVSWTAPSTGGAPATYTVTPYIGATAQTPKVVNGSPPATSTTVTGLTQGTTYTFRVTASNPAGSGPQSAASNPVTPTAPVAPSAPTDVAAQPASQSARVTWTTPSADGDSPITGYTVTPYFDGTTPTTPTQVGASATSATINNLVNGTTYTFKVIAANAVGNSPASAASNAVIPQSTIFDFTAPAVADSGDTNGVEVGMKFKPAYDGTITGIRFYKAAANTGPHVGSLWSSTGTRLAQVTFTGETASGWQTALFSTPVSVTGGTTYVASYHAPHAHYSATSGGLSSAVTNGPLQALSDATSANGVYAYTSTASTFPTNTYQAANYWLDVMYAMPKPGSVTNVSAVEAGKTSANVSWDAPASGGPVTSYRVTPYVGSTPQTPKIVNGSPPATSTAVTGLTTGTTYTFRVEAVNANGSGPMSNASNAVTPAAAVAPASPTNVIARPATNSARVSWDVPGADGDSPITSYRVTPFIGSTAQTPVQVDASTTTTTITGLSNGTSYTFRVSATNAVGTSAQSAASSAVTPRVTILDFAAPATADANDDSSLELGVKFQTDFSGSVTGIRFYKSAANTGTHVGTLWSSTGTPLAQATFTNETASGWQTVTFASPVSISANTTYVASYFAPNGHYSVTPGGFSSAVTNAPLRALANSTSSNGLFKYSGTGAFPTDSYNATNYSVDVLFQPAGQPGQVTGVTATAGQSSATVNWTAPSSGGPPTSYVVTPYIGSTAQTTKTVTGSPPATSTTVNGLTAGTAYTFRVRASNPSGDGPDSAASNSVTPTAAGVPGAPTGVSAEADSKSAVVAWTAPTDEGGSNLTGYTVTPFAGSTALAGVDVSASTTRTRVTGLTNNTAYTFRVAARNSVGTGTNSAASSAVTPRASLFELGTPAIADSGDGSSVVLGVKFTPDVNGTITGLRFHKAATNTGTHLGALWTAAGAPLGSGTFTNESASGWQTLTLSSPVPVTAGTTYVASYLAPNGHYSLTPSAFSSPFDNAPLHAVSDSTSPNGVYAYSSTSVYPSGSYNASNYWVDVLFAPGS